MTAFLSLNHLYHSYHNTEGENASLADINLQISQGEFVALVGPSGCGKSTLLSLIAGLLKPERGEILLHGQDISLTSHAIGYMLQRDHLFDWRNTRKNVLLGPELTHKNTPVIQKKAENLLSSYGLSDFIYAKPYELSGGMRQRAALIRTMMTEPELLLLDEPFSALDYQTRLTVSDDICRILREQGMTAILVTHDISEAISFADRVVILTARPATISAIIPIDLRMDSPLASPLAARSSPLFTQYFNCIWKELTQQ